MSYIKINGIEFDSEVSIMAYARTFKVLDGPNAGRVMSGSMVRDIIGTYIGHKMTLSRRGDNYAGLDSLWDYLLAHSVDDSVMLEAADGQTVISYEAYYTTATQEIEQVVDGVVYWGEIEITFTPMQAQVTPTPMQAQVTPTPMPALVTPTPMPALVTPTPMQALVAPTPMPALVTP